MPIVVDACVAQHQGDRAEQQDRAVLLAHPTDSGVALAVVADGMGGHAGGALAAEQVVHTARQNFGLCSVRREGAQPLLQSCLQEAHLLIKASRFTSEKDPHSTAAMLLLQPGLASWAHCGDSRLYHFRGDRLLARTIDHSYVERLIEEGRITPAQAQVHPNRNILLTSLGGDEDPRVDYGEAVGLRAGDAFLLCSDGLWGYFGEGELGGVVAAFPAREACDLLIQRARTRARGAGDNISVVVLKLVEAPAAAGKSGA